MFKIKKYFSASLVLIISGLIIPVSVKAGAFNDGLGSVGEYFYNIGRASSLLGIIFNVISAGFGIAALLALLFLVIGGFRYIVSFGNADQSQDAKRTIVYAIIGLAVSISAYTIVKIVSQALFGG